MTEDASKVADLLGKSRTAMLTTIEPDGTMVSRPMATQQTEPGGDLWFFASKSSDKITNLSSHPQVNVTVGSDSTWVSLTGRGVVVEDLAKKKELWNPVVAAWFPDGPEDADIVLLKVEGESAEYWDSPGGRIATLISFAKAKATGQPYSGGENETVKL